jgi:hypothetical protein
MRSYQMGVLHPVLYLYLQDQEGLEVAVQAVHKLGPGAPGGAYLVVRPLQPACSRPDLPQFLIRAQHEVGWSLGTSQHTLKLHILVAL